MRKNLGGAVIVGTKERIHRSGSRWRCRSYVGITHSPELMVAGHNDKVIWTVLNLSSAQVRVELIDFVMAVGPGHFVTLGIRPKPVDVKPGRAKLISAKVPGAAQAGCYTYTILIDGRPALDPELQIED